MAGYVSTYALLKDFLTSVLGITTFRQVPSNLAYDVPLAVVARFGGSDRTITLDVARVDIDYFASTEDTAEAGGELIRAAMRTRLHGRMYGGAVVGRVETFTAPRLLPWDAPDVYRCNAGYQIVTHQYVGIS